MVSSTVSQGVSHVALLYMYATTYGHSGGKRLREHGTNMIDPMKDPSKLPEQALNDLNPKDRKLIEKIKEQPKWPKDY